MTCRPERVLHRIVGGCALYSFLLLTACGAEPGDRDVAEGAAAGAAERSTLPRIDRPSGPWAGMATCAGRDFPLRLELRSTESVAEDAPTATLHFEEALNSRGYAAPHGWPPSVELTAKWHGPIGLLKLEAGGSAPRGASASLLVAPGADVGIAKLDGCEFAVLARPASDHGILKLPAELKTLQDRPALTEADRTGACPVELETLIQKALRLDLDGWGRGDTSSLWTDATAREVFGKPWSRIGAEARIEYFRALMGRCGERGDRRRGGVIRELAAMTNYRSFRDARMRHLSSEAIRAWQSQFDAVVAAGEDGVPLPLADALELRGLARTFEFADLLGAEDFDALACDTQTRQLLETAMAYQYNVDALADLESVDGDFVRLLMLYERALGDERIDSAAARDIAAHRLPSVAASWAAEAESPDDAAVMAGWLADWPDGERCEGPLDEACDEVRRRFERRLDALARAWAEEESRGLEDLEDRPGSTEVLAAGVDWFVALQEHYGAVLTYGALAGLRRDGEAWRVDLQEDLEKQLLAEIRSARTTPALRALEARYFLPGDLDRRSLRTLRDALRDGIADAQPFSGSGADDYLNALYNRDFAALRRLDAVVLAAIRPVYGLLARQMALFDDLAAATAGARPLRPVVNELLSPSALRAAAMTYLLDYETHYGECLGAEAVRFTFTERRDIVTRSGRGVELSRIEGITTSTHYRVKPALAGLFRDSFSRPPDGGGERMYEILFGDDGVTRVNASIRQVMGEFACDSREILGLEAGMIAYHRELLRIWSGT